MIKYFVQSPVEKQYILKIEEEIEQSVILLLIIKKMIKGST